MIAYILLGVFVAIWAMWDDARNGHNDVTPLKFTFAILFWPLFLVAISFADAFD